MSDHVFVVLTSSEHDALRWCVRCGALRNEIHPNGQPMAVQWMAPNRAVFDRSEPACGSPASFPVLEKLRRVVGTVPPLGRVWSPSAEVLEILHSILVR